LDDVLKLRPDAAAPTGITDGAKAVSTVNRGIEGMSTAATAEAAILVITKIGGVSFHTSTHKIDRCLRCYKLSKIKGRRPLKNPDTPPEWS